jgi:non-specific serine/threonine protein kinase
MGDIPHHIAELRKAPKRGYTPHNQRIEVLEVRLIGTFDIRCDGKPVTLSSRVAQSLFAYLILTAGTVHRREKLAGMFWPDQTEKKARAYLRYELWRVRKALAGRSGSDYLNVDDISVCFNSSVENRVDVNELENVSESASTDELMAALSNCQRELLPGFYDEWLVLEREHFQAVHEQKIAHLLELLEGERRWLETVEWAERWISAGHGPETAYRYLMIAYDALGDRAKVASSYQRCAQSLRELDLEPSEQTRALALKRTSKVNIPIPLTSFIGREKELKEVAGLFSKSRLITLTGSGGVGKTRLAIQAAGAVLNLFPDGVWFLDLAPLSDPALVPGTAAKLLGLRETGEISITDLLIDYLRFRKALIIFDNCEHLIEACTGLVYSLLTGCETVSILATSRESLRVSGEIPYRVPSLEIPRPDIELTVNQLSNIESVRLFIERAAFASVDFAVSSQNVIAAAQICQRLDGIPLAIELAAARINVLTVRQILNRLNHRFNILSSGSRTALPRHQTLRATIEWSYDLLSASEQTLLRRLSVFLGGFTLDAAESVAAGDIVLKSEIIDLLGRLINKSLVTVVDRSGADGENRFGMLETIRQYTNEKLRETEENNRVGYRHLEFFVNLVEEIEASAEYPDQRYARLESELENLRLALDQALESHEIIAALQLFSALGELRRFWITRNHYHEGVARLKTILAHPHATQSMSARLKALNMYFHMLWQSGELMDVQALMEEALALSMQLDDRRDIAFTLCYFGLSGIANGDYPLARSYLEQSLEIWQELQDLKFMGWSYGFLGEVAMFQDDTERAQTLYDQAILFLNKAKDYIFLALPIRRLGQLEILRGHLPKAKTFISESLQNNWAMRDYRGVGACLAIMGALSTAQSQENRAARLFGAVEVVLEFIQVPLFPFDQQQYERNVNKLRVTLNAPAFARSWMEGRMMTTEQAVAYALDGSH